MRFKRLLIIVLFLGMSISSETVAQEIKTNSSALFYKKDKLSFNHSTLNIDGSIYVPATDIAEQLSILVDYNSPILNFRYGKNYNILSFSTIKSGIHRNGILISDNVGAKLIDGTIYVPLRELCQNIGYKISIIKDKDNSEVIYIYDDYISDEDYEKKNYGFAISLLQSFHENENVTISPLGLKSLLGMVANGMEGEGSNEILSLFETNDIVTLNTIINNETDETIKGQDIEFNVLNSIWKMESKDLKWNEEYLKKIKKYYNGTAVNVNTQNAVSKINKWITENTKESTKNLIIKADFESAFTNITFFGALWSHPFQISDTKEGDFYNYDGTTVKTKFMNQKYELDYYEEVELQAVTMGYVDTPIEMTFILTNNQLNNDMLNRIFEFNKKAIVTLSIPKFQIQTEKNYKELLKKIGIKTMFTPEANFSLMFLKGGKEMLADKVIQNASILINEKGTTVTAATYSGADMSNLTESQIKFIADKPFYYCLRNSKTGEIIFIGQLKHIELGNR